MQVTENKEFTNLSDLYEMISQIQKGWKCPVCKKVYSPKINKCYNCNSKFKIIFNHATNPYFN